MLTFTIPNYEKDQTSLSKPSRSKKRARLVCTRCHEKKIRCDLLKESTEEQPSKCSNCNDASTPCKIRPSRRGRRRARIPSISRDETDTNPAAQASVLEEEEEEDSDSTQPGPENESHSVNPEVEVCLPQPPPAPEPQAQQPLQPDLSFSPTCPIPQLVPHLSEFHSAVPTSSKKNRHPSYLGDSGYMQIFRDDVVDLNGAQSSQVPGLDYTTEGLQEGHLDVFFEFGSTWCPIIDRETLNADPRLRQSLLLKNALALCANQISPSLLKNSSSEEDYSQAKVLFYGNHEPNLLIRIISIMLFYWWSAEPPNEVSLDNTSWWTGTAIRVAQQLGLHCESQSRSSTGRLIGESPGLRRRIWWTLVARERITAISQGRPCLVDLRDCDTPMPTVDDFPQPHNVRVSLFVKWIPLCELIGRIGDMLRRKPDDGGFTALQLAQELITWVQALPSSLQPAFQTSRTTNFHRDVHGMHLTYLSTITLLHLDKDAQPLPRASVAAIVAASCTARIFHDYLIRGSISFLAGQAGWYLVIAILALLHARRLDGLRVHAEGDIHILRTALGVMAKTWHSAQMFERGIEKLMSSEPHSAEETHPPLLAATQSFSPSLDHASPIDGINCKDYFPFATGETSPLISTVFAQDAEAWSFPDMCWTFDFPTHLNQILTGSESINLDYLSL